MAEAVTPTVKVGQNLQHPIGDYQPFFVDVKDLNGDAVDLTGLLAAQWEVSDYDTLNTSVLTKTLGAGITVNDAAAGRLLVVIDFGDTNAFSAQHYYHEMQCRFADGTRRTIMTGDFHAIGTHVT